MNWKGVMPAITTTFSESLAVDHDFVAKHCGWLLDHGCTGIVAFGSLGEGATLSFEEKLQVLYTCIGAVRGRGPVVATVAALSTADAVTLAKAAAELGCDGIMVLPPYVYRGDWREMKAHVAAVLEATPLGCMLYNNPIAYGTDFLPEQICELAAEHANLEAVKESSGDTGRVIAIRGMLDRRLEILAGVDDLVLDAVGAGAGGWIAGLANALPRESVELFSAGINGETGKAQEILRWFLPLLRMDTVPKFVQLIKLVQTEVGIGNCRVRPPRLELVGKELQETRRTIHEALNSRPQFTGSYVLPRSE